MLSHASKEEPGRVLAGRVLTGRIGWAFGSRSKRVAAADLSILMARRANSDERISRLLADCLNSPVGEAVMLAWAAHIMQGGRKAGHLLTWLKSNESKLPDRAAPIAAVIISEWAVRKELKPAGCTSSEHEELKHKVGELLRQAREAGRGVAAGKRLVRDVGRATKCTASGAH